MTGGVIHAMRIITGKPLSPGHAQGRAALPGANQPVRLQTTIAPNRTRAELARFRAALETAHQELAQLQARVRSELGSEAADIFSAHLLFLRDPQFTDRVKACIRDDHLSLEAAIQVTVDELSGILEHADNTYLRERAADVRDLHRRLLRHIAAPGKWQLARLAPDSILVARELLPSDMLELDREHIAGIITETGGETGHAAILARALGIPAVTGIADATLVITPGMPLLIDGQTGEVVLEPDPEQLHASIASRKGYERQTLAAIDAEACECTTGDGIQVHLFANIGRPVEVHEVAAHHLEGVGLFRTEYLFLDEPAAPSFERQRDIYREAAATLESLPLVIRTLDLGGDKWPSFLKPRFEANPNLGVRGLRFSLMSAEDLFRTQIRAILHTATMHDVRVMLPMVLGRADLLHAAGIIEDVARKEGVGSPPPLGALIETPAAVFAIDEILAACDFVSIGTNDLTQFMLAADRNALAMIDDYTVLHPSVLRAVQLVIDAAQTAGKPATVCGEAASDPRVACLLIGLGARRLSMSPLSAARVRIAVRHSHLSSLEELARTALSSDSPQTVSVLATEHLNNTCPDLRPDFKSTWTLPDTRM
jgi:phosphoenolpyruvate-protein phosphotransferase